MKYYVANWKANKNLDEAKAWLVELSALIHLHPFVDKIIVCPPTPYIIPLSKMAEDLKIELGAQNLSQYPLGSYTGETTAKQLKGHVEYALIGHNERRVYFHENEEILSEKFVQAKMAGIEPIYCIRSVADKIPDETKIVAYEPVTAIGSGQNEDPEKVINVKNSLFLQDKKAIFLYGGSVTKDNAKAYIKTGEIDGFLIGSESLTARNFFEIISVV